MRGIPWLKPRNRTGRRAARRTPPDRTGGGERLECRCLLAAESSVAIGYNSELGFSQRRFCQREALW